MKRLVSTVLLCALAVAPGAAAELPAPVAEVMRAASLPSASLSILVMPAAGGAPLLALRPDVPRNPASTMKLVTTFAGLELLGPGFVWNTDVYLPPGVEIGPGGRLPGDLYLRGGGDPFLVTESLWSLFSRLRREGLERIAGDVLIDRAYFQSPAGDPGAFDGKPWRAYNVGPDAALINFRASRIRLVSVPGRSRPRIATDPPLEGLTVTNEVRSVAGRCRGRVRLLLEVPEPDTPRIRLRGALPRRCRAYGLVRVIASRDAYARGVIRPLWSELGGKLDGEVRPGTVPEGARRLLRHRSETLSRLIWGMNKFSNNVMTRQLFLTLAAEHGDGTEAHARTVIREWLARRGIPTKGLVIENGAGLSRRARISATTLGALLRRAYEGPLRAEFVASLPLAAVDGTMRARLEGPRTAGKAHLKTGLLDGVRALAGYVHLRYLGDLVVVVLQNAPGVQNGAGTRVQDALLEWLFQRDRLAGRHRSIDARG